MNQKVTQDTNINQDPIKNISIESTPEATPETTSKVTPENKETSAQNIARIKLEWRNRNHNLRQVQKLNQQRLQKGSYRSPRGRNTYR